MSEVEKSWVAMIHETEREWFKREWCRNERKVKRASPLSVGGERGGGEGEKGREMRWEEGGEMSVGPAW